MKNKKLSMVILIIKNLLPMSRYAVRRDNKSILQLLHAQTEFMMMNRREIMALAISKQTTDKKSSPVVSKTNNSDNMYG